MEAGDYRAPRLGTHGVERTARASAGNYELHTRTTERRKDLEMRWLGDLAAERSGTPMTSHWDLEKPRKQWENRFFRRADALEAAETGQHDKRKEWVHPKPKGGKATAPRQCRHQEWGSAGTKNGAVQLHSTKQE